MHGNLTHLVITGHGNPNLNHQCVNQVMGWENIELISDRPLEVMLEEFSRLKAEFPDRSADPPRQRFLFLPLAVGSPVEPSDPMGLQCRILIASIMEEYNKDSWQTLIAR